MYFRTNLLNRDLRCQAEQYKTVFNYNIPEEVIVDVDCVSQRAIDAGLVEDGLPELWQHHLENGFYVVPYFFDINGNHTEHEKTKIRAALKSFQELVERTLLE